MKIFFVALSMTLTASACGYDARFNDCAAIHCSMESGCPNGLTCGVEGLCRSLGAPATCGDAGSDGSSDATAPSLSCAGLSATCGPTASDDCCSTAMPIPGGTFYRSYDVAGDGMYSDQSFPATVSAFVLDKYEVTVGRFRKFVDAGMGTQGAPPAQGAGAHVKISGSGWDASWDGNLATVPTTLKAAVKCTSAYQTWTDNMGANESLPMNCVTWYEAFAFCIWDGGYLPTEAEFNFAAAGGSEQRAYPWSSPPSSTGIDCSYANFNVNVPSGTYCVNGMMGGVNRVGSESPKGDGKWGQADLAGNAFEWTLDGDGSYSNPCEDCTSLTNMASRNIRGGSFLYGAPFQRVATRKALAVNFRGSDIGVRCARASP